MCICLACSLGLPLAVVGVEAATDGGKMGGHIRNLIVSLAIGILLVLGVATPSLAAYQGRYGKSVSNQYSTKLITGEHSSSYGRATASVDYDCAGGGIFWVEVVGGGRCTDFVAISPRTTQTMTYRSSFTGSVQLFAQGSNAAASPYYMRGNYCFNVR